MKSDDLVSGLLLEAGPDIGEGVFVGYITAQEGGGAWGVNLHTSQTNQNNSRVHMTNRTNENVTTEQI